MIVTLYHVSLQSTKYKYLQCLCQVVRIGNEFRMVVAKRQGQMSGEYILLSSVLSQQKFEARDVRALGMSQLSDRLCYSSQASNRLYYSSQTDQCYSSILFRKQQENTSWRREGMPTQRHEERREPWPFGSPFYMFCPPPGLPYVNWASQECHLFYLKSSLQSSDLPLFHFRRLLPSLSFSHQHSGLLFPFLIT